MCRNDPTWGFLWIGKVTKCGVVKFGKGWEKLRPSLTNNLSCGSFRIFFLNCSFYQGKRRGDFVYFSLQNRWPLFSIYAYNLACIGIQLSNNNGRFLLHGDNSNYFRCLWSKCNDELWSLSSSISNAHNIWHLLLHNPLYEGAVNFRTWNLLHANHCMIPRSDLSKLGVLWFVTLYF